ncbi:Delta-1-pyrroline-5-carboxylate dehydrogenase 12A1, mitochondrial [Glycine soja]|uniref:Delta-1-pyrroline-5-carboxylate dehydrogenase 12A1, mitochondrial n=1 Tax=Glycine soja TaxID=3848 RepID=A0A0B2QZ12_GLYSO|nr:Delta-1-pyrroline-5-carboxylate dehydrogenase 12A1, mitochondrial [Glycine soja]
MFGEISAKAAHMLSLPKVRFLVRSFAVPGNHVGQRCHGFRWPYGPVTIITPFNFPLEIHALQLMGALYMANKPVLKIDSKSKISLLSKLEDLAERRKLANLTIDSVLTVSIACLLFPPSSNCSRI